MHSETHMSGHILQPSLPPGHIEVFVSKPGVAVGGGATPLGLGNVIVQVEVDLLLEAFCSDRIKDLS